MGLETVTNVSDLNPLWPLSSDVRAEGDNHIRNLKVALLSLVSDPSQVNSRHVDHEIPSGVENGSQTLTLAHAPSPAASLHLYKNGILLIPTVDYTLSSVTVTLSVAIIIATIYDPGPPESFTDHEDRVRASYRY